MHTLARHPVREARLNGQARLRAFTLIELLTVIAIIAILAAITFGAISGVRERAAISKARAELASLGQALESYKLQYGDYPRSAGPNVSTTSPPTETDGPGVLLNALVGKLGPYASSTNTAATINGRSFVELSKFTVQDSAALPLTSATLVVNALVDPWGRRYLYYYKTGTSAEWIKRSDYILLSVGPSVAEDGSPGITVSTDGSYVSSDTTNEPDNIYAK